MNEINIFKHYPDCITDRHNLRGVLLDFFPGENLKVNLVLAAFDAGIIRVIEQAAKLDEQTQLGIWKTLVDEFGYKEEHAAWAVSYWMSNYGSYALRKVYDFVDFPSGNGKQILAYQISESNADEVSVLKAQLERVKSEVTQAKEEAEKAAAEAKALKMELSEAKAEADRLRTMVAAKEGVQQSALEDNSAFVAKNFRYVTKDSEVLIKKYIGKGGEVVIPDYIDGLPVTRIADWAFGGRGGKRIHKIQLPKHLQYIGAGAFQGLEISGVLVLPKSIVDIGDAAFEGSRLGGLVVQSDCNLDLNSFGAIDELEFIYVAKGCRVRIHSSTFYLSEALADIVLPKEVTYIGEENFENCGEAVMYAPEGSRAAKYAKKNAIDVDSEQYESMCEYYENRYLAEQ